ncbi:MAG TPA: hydrogen peroxide-dependent heme synthase [Ornithinimicrobium sp.]|uniref:hydrogen peroxide-dependent heme synthase n=1 Tax=Ornithinimicrobium sp. TaxID=1977084 RepID=UPI002B4A8F6F|nr:hydrogen peroxide-dependent heme synthase [Ornithinimicrobium sp.]HKJ12268.1 hydrogen peroxide-dependent heme synthase [Ornithinimicrobium sp.]
MSTAPSPEPSRPTTDLVEQINAGVRYAMYSVFRFARRMGSSRSEMVDEADRLLRDLEDEGVVVRGCYDVSGLRADADLMLWWHAERIEAVQSAYQRFRRTELGQHTEPVWSQVALHRPAEFNKGHVPAFLAGEEPRGYLCVYPFVRSYEWYLMDAGERSAMLREHGLAAKDFGDVRANTLSSFALGDYEWILAFEADDLTRIVDLMRELRNTRARLHVREEVPFYTGPRVTVDQIVASAP